MPGTLIRRGPNTNPPGHGSAPPEMSHPHWKMDAMTSSTLGLPPDPRIPRPPQADERTTLDAFLRWHRLTLEVKCSGLSPEQLACRSAGQSRLSLLGLIRHHTEGERFWFRHVMAGQDAPTLYASSSNPDAAFEVAGADAAMVTAAWHAWRAEVSFAEQLVAQAADLDVAGHEPGAGPVSLRWVMLHMIEEYARHNGHADLLREQIDGTVGL
jgi:Protein of unknown function (DUF664)